MRLGVVTDCQYKDMASVRLEQPSRTMRRTAFTKCIHVCSKGVPPKGDYACFEYV
jgi:hypothetical protein